MNQTEHVETRNKLLKVVDDYFIDTLELQHPNEISELAQVYLKRGVIPAKKVFDALHIATQATRI